MHHFLAPGRDKRFKSAICPLIAAFGAIIRNCKIAGTSLPLSHHSCPSPPQEQEVEKLQNSVEDPETHALKIQATTHDTSSVTLQPLTISINFPTDSSDRQPSPGLSSNNPFRNRTISPTGSLPQSPVTNAFQIPSTAPERPTSRNPFLDQGEKKDQTLVNVRPASPLKDSNMSRRASPPKPTQPTLTGHAAELFVSAQCIASQDGMKELTRPG